MKKDITLECDIELIKNSKHYYLIIKHNRDYIFNIEYDGIILVKDYTKSNKLNYEIEISDSGDFKIFVIN